MSDDSNRWKRCSSCKTEIGFRTTHWVCSVSTCTRKRTGLVFCSVACWEMHLPMMRHREAYAVEARSPSQEEYLRELEEDSESTESSPGRRRITVASPEPPAKTAEDDVPHDILVVASKLKQYIRARSGMNTSDSVLPILSDHLRELCNQAIRNAAQDGRKTVLDRDIPRPSLSNTDD